MMASEPSYCLLINIFTFCLPYFHLVIFFYVYFCISSILLTKHDHFNIIINYTIT